MITAPIRLNNKDPITLLSKNRLFDIITAFRVDVIAAMLSP